MLLHLQIRHFAIVPELEQSFAPGFTAISGETGAGKSILVDALGLLLGARSDASWVRDGADRAELTAEFSVATNTEALDWLREQALDDGEHCLLRRAIQAGGRSRAWINGTPVTVGQLAELGHLLVEVHGQNEHVRLTSPRQQRRLLDQTGDYAGLCEAVSAAHARWLDARSALDELLASTALTPAEQDYLRLQLEELDAQSLEPSALETLEQHHRRLSRSGEWLKALEQAQTHLDEDATGALPKLQAALRCLEGLRGDDEGIDSAAGMLDEAQILLQEAASALQSTANDVELDPERLAQVETELSALHGLARKHGVAVDALAPVREALAQRLERASDFETQRESLEQATQQALDDYRQAAVQLNAARTEHAADMSRRVEANMGELGMAGGRFLLTVHTDPDRDPSPYGDDRVEMAVSANPGLAPGPLGKVASGGELSRISLALKVAGRGAAGRTQVFDEVDTGVGGDTANAVGRLLRDVGSSGQALCVTHLAQVAVRADQQLQVMKTIGADTTSVSTQALDEAARVDEIARMLGGSQSDQSRAHAREMLEAARSSRH